MSFGQFNPSTNANEFNTLMFVIQQAMLKMQTATLVKVIHVSNAGGVSPVGTVDVQPLVNQMTGDRKPFPHGVINNIPYCRIQGGANAVILDPVIGDIGICCFASRDISAVKANKAAANPNSYRVFDFADGMYIGGFLNGTPTQYVQFSASGITLVSPVQVSISAPTIAITGTTAVNIGGGHTSIDGKLFLAHTHTNVQTGTGVSGPPS